MAHQKKDKNREQVLRKKAIKEIICCQQDPIYFIRNYCYVQHPIKGVILFDLYDYQEEAIKNFLVQDKVIINKARQLGFSTLTAAFIVWLILFHKDKQVLVVSTRAEVAKNLVKKVKVALKNLPDWMYLADITSNQKHMVELSNGSWVKSVARTQDLGRSEALSLLVIDEAAHIRDMDELYKGLASTVALGGKTIALSTPAGMGNWFYEQYSKAEIGENEFYPMKVHWWQNPEYSEDLEDDPKVPGGKTSSWFRRFTAGMSDHQIAQELLTSFIETGDTFIHGEVIKKYDDMTQDPVDKMCMDKGCWIWKKPNYKKKYLVVADTAEGSYGGEDYCAAVVLDIIDCEIVADYKGKIAPDVFAEFLIEIAEYYHNAHIVPEQNASGLATALTIKNLNYKNLTWIDPEDHKLIDKWTAQYKQINPGYKMTPKYRPVILSKFQEFMHRGYLISHSKRLTQELYTFIVQNGRAQARKHCNDDLVISAALAVWIRDVVPEFSQTNPGIDYAKLYGSATVVSTPYDEAINNRDRGKEEKERIRKQMEDQARVNLGNGHYEDLSWIYKM